MSERAIPTALNVIAILFLLAGIAAVFNILNHLLHRSIHFDLNVLGIPIYFGLRSFSKGWRTCALVFIWLGLIITPVVTVLGFTIGRPVTLNFFGAPQSQISPLWMSAAGVAFFLLALWQYRVLTRPGIRALFYPGGNSRPL